MCAKFTIRCVTPRIVDLCFFSMSIFLTGVKLLIRRFQLLNDPSHCNQYTRTVKWVKKKVQIRRTQGLISEDRSNEATLPLTIPRSVFKQSAKDLSKEIFLIRFRFRRQTFSVLWLNPDVTLDAEAPIFVRLTSLSVGIVPFQPGFWLRGVQP